MTTNLLNNNLNIKKAFSKEIVALNKVSNNKLITNLKLINNINKNINYLKYQFAVNNNNSIKFILNNIIKQFNPNILFYNLLIKNNNENNIIKLLLLNKQLSLIKTISKRGLNINLSNLNTNNIKLILNIKIIKLIIKNNILLANIVKNNPNNNLNNSIIGKLTSNNYTNNKIIFNKIKESLLSYNYYNNKSKNNNNLLKNNIIKFKWLGTLLSNIFNKNVSIELIRFWNVGLDPTILAKIISKNSYTDKSSIIFKKLWKKIVINQANKLTSLRQNNILKGNELIYNDILLKNISNNFNGINKLISEDKANLKFNQVNDFNNNVNTIISNPLTLAKTVGLSVKIGGRLSRERIQPKQTVKKLSVGSVKNNNTKVIDSYKFTNKNKRGAFTISVRLCSARTYSTACRTIVTNTKIFNF